MVQNQFWPPPQRGPAHFSNLAQGALVSLHVFRDIHHGVGWLGVGYSYHFFIKKSTIDWWYKILVNFFLVQIFSQFFSIPNGCKF